MHSHADTEALHAIVDNMLKLKTATAHDLVKLGFKNTGEAYDEIARQLTDCADVLEHRINDVAPTLRAIIEQHGLNYVITLLELICVMKAMQCSGTGRAKAWQADAVTMHKAAQLVCAEAPTP